MFLRRLPLGRLRVTTSPFGRVGIDLWKCLSQCFFDVGQGFVAGQVVPFIMAILNQRRGGEVQLGRHASLFDNHCLFGHELPHLLKC